MAQRRKADLHHVVAAARTVEQGAKQNVYKNGTGRHTQRDPVNALGGQPHV